MIDRATIERNREEWLTTLEEGKLPQAQGVLCDLDDESRPSGFCCLGVVYELAQIPYAQTLDTDYRRYLDPQASYSNEKATSFLGPKGKEWLGVASSDPRPAWPESMLKLTAAGMNDDGWSFARIAEAFRTYGFDPEDDLLQQ